MAHEEKNAPRPDDPPQGRTATPEQRARLARLRLRRAARMRGAANKAEAPGRVRRFVLKHPDLGFALGLALLLLAMLAGAAVVVVVVRAFLGPGTVAGLGAAFWLLVLGAVVSVHAIGWLLISAFDHKRRDATWRDAVLGRIAQGGCVSVLAVLFVFELLLPFLILGLLIFGA